MNPFDGIIELLRGLTTPVSQRGNGVIADQYASKPSPKINPNIISPQSQDEMTRNWYRSQYLAKNYENPQQFPIDTPISTSTPTPTPSPTPIPLPTPTLLPNAPENPYMSLIQQYFPSDQANNASNLMWKESSYRPNIVNVNSPEGNWQRTVNNVAELLSLLSVYPNSDVGPYQINNKWQSRNLANQGYSIEDMIDPEKAIRYAAWLQSQQGWNPWVAASGLGLK